MIKIIESELAQMCTVFFLASCLEISEGYYNNQSVRILKLGTLAKQSLK